MLPRFHVFTIGSMPNKSHVKTNEVTGVVEFVCSYCAKRQYGLFGIIPGFAHCDENGHIEVVDEV